jgi:parvulin-like peptidyl-prolyl isomerase
MHAHALAPGGWHGKFVVMVRCFLSVFLITSTAGVVSAQAPVPADKVVARVDGKDITAAELRQIIAAAGPVFLNSLKANPADAIDGYFVLHEIGQRAEKLNLADQSPWKEQIEFERTRILTNAALSHELNAYMPPEADVQKRYEAEKFRYEQVSVRLIKIGFQPQAKPAGASDEDLKKAAQAVVESAHNASRSESQARVLADDIVRKARSGGDFKQLVKEYSEDEETKAHDGDFGTISGTSAYPADLQKAALALKPGEVSEPVKVSVAFYILRCETKTAQPLNDVREALLRQLRQEHVDTYMKDIQKRFQPVIVDPQALLQIGNGK